MRDLFEQGGGRFPRHEREQRDCAAGGLDRPAFLYLIQRDPEFALRIMQLLANRLRRMNSNL